MNMITVLNDLHIGVNRVTGTTAASRLALRGYVLDEFERLVHSVTGSDLCILGDLFDGPAVPNEDFARTYDILCNWLSANEYTTNTLYLVNGNHDLSKDSSVMSSFQLLADLIYTRGNVEHISRPGWLGKGANRPYVIPHMTNQEEFQDALLQVPECGYLLLHCNYDNKFARKSDHSLNLDAGTAADVPAGTIVIAHEHQQKTALAGKVQIIGNQIPTSIADCLGNDEKRFVRLHAKSFEYVSLGPVSSYYREFDWRNLYAPTDSYPFVRVTGTATDAESASALQAVSKFRDDALSFVVANAIKIGETALDAASLEDALHSVQGFDVLPALRAMIPTDAMRRMFDSAAQKVAPAEKDDY